MLRQRTYFGESKDGWHVRKLRSKKGRIGFFVYNGDKRVSGPHHGRSEAEIKLTQKQRGRISGEGKKRLQKMILDAVHKGCKTIKDIAKEVGETESRVATQVKNLEKAGKVSVKIKQRWDKHYVVGGNAFGGTVVCKRNYKEVSIKESLCEDDQQRQLRAAVTDDNRRLPNLYKIVPASYMKKSGWNGKSMVTIYRGIGPTDPFKNIRPGDWVTLKKSTIKKLSGGKILKRTVNAYDIVWAGTDMNEWFYSPIRGMK